MALCSMIASAADITPGPGDGVSLTFVYEEPDSDDLKDLFRTLRDSRILESWTDYVNRTLKRLPHSIQVAFAQCGKGGATYDRARERITLCYEEADRSFGVLTLVGYESQTQLLTSWIGSMLHQLYHELAHALVEMLQLPVLGRMEDAADQFAVIVLLGHPQGGHLVLGAADYLRELATIEADGGMEASDPHPLISQRYYNTLCLMYGADPEQHAFLVTQQRLPEARAKSCTVEYARAAYGWSILLGVTGR
jgi:hypothetical protein